MKSPSANPLVAFALAPMMMATMMATGAQAARPTTTTAEGAAPVAARSVLPTVPVGFQVAGFTNRWNDPTNSSQCMMVQPWAPEGLMREYSLQQPGSNADCHLFVTQDASMTCWQGGDAGGHDGCDDTALGPVAAFFLPNCQMHYQGDCSDAGVAGGADPANGQSMVCANADDGKTFAAFKCNN